MNLLRQSYDRLSEAERNTEGGKAQLLSIQQLDTALKALDGQQGRFNRNVGDYKQQYNGLNVAVQQVLRETPSAAVSLNTFFLAISNNLPMLFDELQKTSAKAKEFAEQLTAANTAQAAAKGISDAAAQAADGASDSLSAQLETVVGSITASREQAAALREQILATVSSGTATAEQAEITAVNTEAQLLNAGATAEDALAIRNLITSQAAATIASQEATVALEAQALATAEVAAVGARSPSVFKSLVSSLFSFNTALTLGVLALILFGGKIVDFIGTLFNGKDAIDDAKENLQNLNAVIKESAKDAATQTSSLKALYDSATNANIPLAERIKYVQELKREFPAYFGQLTNEAILNGQAKISYDELSKSILESAKARAAKSKIDTLAAQQLEFEFSAQKVRNATDAEAARVRPYQTDIVTGGGNFGSGYSGGTKTVTITAEYQKSVIAERRNAALAEIDENKATLQRQIDFLTQYVGGEKAIADGIVTVHKEQVKEVKDHASRLDAATQDAFKLIDAERSRRLADAETAVVDIRKANRSTYEIEVKYLQDVEEINKTAIAKKRAIIKQSNEEEKATFAQLGLDRANIEAKTQDGIVALRKKEADRLKEVADSEYLSLIHI